MNKSNLGIILASSIVLGICCLVGLCIFLGLLSSPSSTSNNVPEKISEGTASVLSPTETIANTPIPAPTQDLSLKLSLIEFTNYYDSLTDLQKADYIQSVNGKTVDWTGSVFEVQDDGTVLVNIPSTLTSMVSLKGVSLETAKTINKDAYINFTGTISDVSDFLGLHVYLINAKVKP